MNEEPNKNITDLSFTTGKIKQPDLFAVLRGRTFHMKSKVCCEGTHPLYSALSPQGFNPISAGVQAVSAGWLVHICSQCLLPT